MTPDVLDALDALVARLRASPSLTPDMVFDGPEAAWPTGDLIAVGLAPNDFTVDGTSPPSALSGPFSQAGQIPCLARSWTGDTAIKPRRDRVRQLYGVVRDLLIVDQTLGGAVDRAEITTWMYVPEVIPNRGVAANLLFTVQARSF